MQAVIILAIIVAFLLARDIWRDYRSQAEREQLMTEREQWMGLVLIKHYGQIPFGKVVGQKRVPTREDIAELGRLDRAPTSTTAPGANSDLESLTLSSDEEHLVTQMVNQTGVSAAEAVRILKEQATGPQDVNLDN